MKLWLGLSSLASHNKNEDFINLLSQAMGGQLFSSI